MGRKKLVIYCELFDNEKIKVRSNCFRFHHSFIHTNIYNKNISNIYSKNILIKSLISKLLNDKMQLFSFFLYKPLHRLLTKLRRYNISYFFFLSQSENDQINCRFMLSGDRYFWYKENKIKEKRKEKSKGKTYVNIFHCDYFYLLLSSIIWENIFIIFLYYNHDNTILFIIDFNSFDFIDLLYWKNFINK